MRLSEAIATGRVLVLPSSGSEWFQDGSGCARGMALEAVGKRLEVTRGQENWKRFLAEWPWTAELHTKKPCDCIFPFSFGSASEATVCGWIVHLFDLHVANTEDWTLDQLIDWVRSVEPAEPAPAESEAKAEVVHAHVDG